MRILLIEDDQTTSHSIELMLKSENFKVDVKNTKKKFFPERGAHSHE